MKKLIATALVGIGMGMGIGTGAAHAAAGFLTYFGTREIGTAHELYVRGYVAGVSDAVTTLHQTVTDPDGAPADPVAYVSRLGVCFTRKDSSDIQLEQWAIQQWRMAEQTTPSTFAKGYSAAAVMLAEICN
jgi:hypothetical protein